MEDKNTFLECQLEALKDSTLNHFLDLIHKFAGITIRSSRKSMVQGRIRKRIMELNIKTYDDYLKLIQEDLSERSIFINLMTTNETYFYRTPRIWDYITKTFLPTWYKNHKNESFTAWSAAAASGEEPYTLALLLQDFRDKNSGFTFQILGTDISQEMVSLCEKGTYTGRSIQSIRTLKREQFEKYMESKDGINFTIKPEIKTRLKFQAHNLFNSLISRGPFDLILVRNVLIYFSQTDQEAVISLLEPKLKPDGLLIIGESESLSHIKTNLKSDAPLLYRRKEKEAA